MAFRFTSRQPYVIFLIDILAYLYSISLLLVWQMSKELKNNFLVATLIVKKHQDQLVEKSFSVKHDQTYLKRQDEILVHNK